MSKYIFSNSTPAMDLSQEEPESVPGSFAIQKPPVPGVDVNPWQAPGRAPVSPPVRDLAAISPKVEALSKMINKPASQIIADYRAMQEAGESVPVDLVSAPYSPSEDLIQFIISRESFLDRPDNRIDGKWTIGYGDTDKALNDYYLSHKNERYTREAAEKRLRERINDEFFGYVKKYLPGWEKLSGPQIDSLISYVYNTGPGGLKDKRLASAVQSGDLRAIAAALNRGWNQRNKETGEILWGLNKRRNFERLAFLYPETSRFGVLPDGTVVDYDRIGKRDNVLDPNWRYNARADGGGIHIQPSHRGRLTELKQRTGKTEAELYNDGNPAHRKMVVFARNARQWNHALGGNLYTYGGMPEIAGMPDVHWAARPMPDGGGLLNDPSYGADGYKKLVDFIKSVRSGRRDPFENMPNYGFSVFDYPLDDLVYRPQRYEKVDSGYTVLPYIPGYTGNTWAGRPYIPSKRDLRPWNSGPSSVPAVNTSLVKYSFGGIMEKMNNVYNGDRDAMIAAVRKAKLNKL